MSESHGRSVPGGGLLTVAEVAATMRVSNMTVYRLIKTASSRPCASGKNYRIRETDVERYLDDRSVHGKGRKWRRAGSASISGLQPCAPPSSGGRHTTVIRAAQVALPPGAVENGEVREPRHRGDALRELWQGGFKQPRGLHGRREPARRRARDRAPVAPGEGARAPSGFQVQEFIPMPVDDAVLDYDRVGEFEQEGRRMLRLLWSPRSAGWSIRSSLAAGSAKLEPMGST